MSCVLGIAPDCVVRCLNGRRGRSGRGDVPCGLCSICVFFKLRSVMQNLRIWRIAMLRDPSIRSQYFCTASSSISPRLALHPNTQVLDKRNNKNWQSLVITKIGHFLSRYANRMVIIYYSDNTVVGIYIFFNKVTTLLCNTIERCAEERTRTSTLLPALEPESSASTNFATSAGVGRRARTTNL